jgi:hypothetical protein
MRKLLASFGLVAFLLTGCASSPVERTATSADSLPALLDALRKTNDAGSGRTALDLTLASPQQTVHVRGEVEYVMDPTDPTSLRERVLLDISSLGMMPGGKVEMIVGEGSAIYIRAPMLASFIPAPTPWIKLDPSTLPQSQAGIGAAATVNPAAILAAIADALAVEEVGPDPVDGVGTTRYRATVDLEKLLPLLAEMVPDTPTDAEMREVKDQLERLGLLSLPIELWVDGDGFLKKAQLALDLSAMDPDHPGTSFSATLRFSDIGEHISIAVPPASQVTDIGDLLAGAYSPVSSLS